VTGRWTEPVMKQHLVLGVQRGSFVLKGHSRFGAVAGRNCFASATVSCTWCINYFFILGKIFAVSMRLFRASISVWFFPVVTCDIPYLTQPSVYNGAVGPFRFGRDQWRWL